MKRLFSIGTLTKYLLIPYFVPFFYSFREVGFYNIYRLGFTAHPLLVSLFMFLSELVCGFYLLFQLSCKTKDSQGKAIVYNNQIVKEEESKENKIEIQNDNTKSFLLICLSAFIDFVGYTCTSLLCAYSDIQLNHIQIEMRIMPTFFMSILSWKMLNFSFYRHHLVSSGIILIGFLMVIIQKFTQVKEPLSAGYIFLIFTAINLAYSFKQIIDKIILDKKGFSTPRLLFYQGLFGIVFCIISYGLTYPIDCKNQYLFCSEGKFENLPKLKDEMTWTITGYLILLFSSSIGLNIFLMLTKSYFTPTHRNVSDTMNSFFAWVINIIFYVSFEKNDWLYLFGYIIIMIGCLIFNEIIICHFFKLAEDTKEEIIKRASLSIEIVNKTKEEKLLNKEAELTEKETINQP